MISVFDYIDYRRFLQDRFLEIKAENRKFSFRQFSAKAGFSSSSTLKMVLGGKRNLTAGSAVKFARAFRLSPKDSAYFENLVSFNQAANEKDKEYYSQRLMSLRPKIQMTSLEKDQYKFFEKRYYPVIREMVALPNFQENATWIASNICPQISPREAKEAIATLINLGLLVRDENGKLQQSHSTITTPIEVESTDLIQFQRFMQNDARDAVERFPRQERDLSSLVIPIQRGKIPEIKTMINEFKENLMDFINKSGNDFHEVFYINIQLFPATTTQKPKVNL